jgi:hypothetical protein
MPTWHLLPLCCLLLPALRCHPGQFLWARVQHCHWVLSLPPGPVLPGGGLGALPRHQHHARHLPARLLHLCLLCSDLHPGDVLPQHTGRQWPGVPALVQLHGHPCGVLLHPQAVPCCHGLPCGVLGSHRLQRLHRCCRELLPSGLAARGCAVPRGELLHGGGPLPLRPAQPLGLPRESTARQAVPPTRAWPAPRE